MTQTNQVTEAELQAKAVAPRVTMEALEENILSVHYINAGHALVMSGDDEDHVHESLDLLTICLVVLKNGFVVQGESACASPENYNRDIGERIVLDNAKRKIWPLMGYELRSQLQDYDKDAEVFLKSLVRSGVRT